MEHTADVIDISVRFSPMPNDTSSVTLGSTWFS
ncbi:hypothetical protein JOD27_005412 [Lentzea nigeriaca]|nr:hypothetical protein [Lentzea nigeriaca]